MLFFRKNKLKKLLLDNNEKLYRCIVDLDCTNALIYAKRILEINIELFSSVSLETASAYYDIGLIYEEMRQFEEALDNQQIALRIRQSLLEPNHLDVAASHFIVGSLYLQTPNYVKALEHSFISLKIKKEHHSLNHQEIAYLYVNIGSAYLSTGNIDLALKYTLEALEILDEIDDANDLKLAVAYNNVAACFGNIGEYYLSINYLNFALDLYRENLPEDHPDIAASLHNLGNIFCDLGEYDRALENVLASINIRLRIFSEDHYDIASSFNLYGRIYFCMGEYPKASDYFLVALSMRTKTLPDTHLLIAESYCNISAAVRALGDDKYSIELAQKALDIYTSCKYDGYNVAELYDNIGISHSNSNEYEESIEWHKKSLEYKKKFYADDHQYVLESIRNLAVAYYNIGDHNNSVSQISSMIAAIPSIFQNTMAVPSEVVRTKCLIYAKSFMNIVHSYNFISEHNLNVKKLFMILLNSKDINTESEFIIRKSDLTVFDPNNAETMEGLNSRRMQYQNLLLNHPEKKKEIKILSEEMLDLEISLASDIREIDFKLHMESMTSEAVLKKLPSCSALIEYGWFFFIKSSSDTRPNVESGGRYYAYLLCDGKIYLHYIDAADELIHQQLYAARKKLIPNNKSDIPKNANKELFTLFQMLVAPFKEKLQDIKHLYIAPDGELFKLPFELLIDENGQAVADRFAISYLSSGRDLVRPEKWNNPIDGYKSAAIFADPLYDVDDKEIKEDGEDGRRNGIPGTTKRQSRDLNTLKGFSRLPFAQAEADAFEKVFVGNLKKYYQRDACKSELSRIGSPNIIHIVTHGFYFDKQELPDEKPMMTLDHKYAHSSAEDPLLRSGLAFAGVNNWLKSKTQIPFDKYGDGILNAKEVVSLDLLETDLLVLSACETGLGEVKNGEGIQGLRRAFELAGVRSLLCTLWSVNDDASAILIGKFYENLLTLKMSKLQALSEAKKYVKKMTVRQQICYYRENGYAQKADEIEEQCFPEDLENTPYGHPYYWAGYILQGETT